MINLSYSKPKRIICLTEETTETLYNFGAEELIIGITKYTVRPERAKNEKEIVSAYIEADINKIIALKPDLVLAWSDLQAGIVSDLIKNGVEVYCFNHRSISGILSMISKLGKLISYEEQADKLVNKIIDKLNYVASESEKLKYKPKIYFEEWFSPLITGSCWVSEIIEICGGLDIFAENRIHHQAKGRILPDDSKIIERNPDVILASWCGKPFRKQTLLKRDNWNNINAVSKDEIYEIDSGIILQPGPAALTDGVDIISKIIQDYNLKYI